MRALLMVVVVACCGCASTGATPRPFPVPGPGPAETPEASRPNGGVSPTGTLPIRTSGYEISGTALSLRGKPYRNGGADPNGFDCSGLVRYVFAQHGVAVPRTVSEQSRAGGDVTGTELAPGDLVFFSTTAPEPHTSASSSAVIHSYTRPHRTALSEWTDWARRTGRRATSARGGCSELMNYER